MGSVILKTEQLCKSYKGINVVDQMSVEITEGKIYGLIGRNGAGKTTFIRMVAGLTKPSSGKMNLYGEENPDQWYQQRKKMSFIVETPYLQLNLTAYENLKLQALQKGVYDEKNIDKLLKMASLEEARNKRVQCFSLGMKQRLGIAISMLSSPAFLVLDEPMNGLDPQGMVDMRKILLGLKENFHATIMISSHLLSELYQIATDYIIMDRGKLVEQITAQQLDSRCSDYLCIGVTEPSEAAKLLEQTFHLQHWEQDQEGFIHIYDKDIKPEKVAQVLVAEKYELFHLAYNKNSLENYFIRKIGGEMDA